MFDSPFDHCPRCGEMVVLDQTHKECAQEHHCDTSIPCPLQKQFCGYDFSAPNSKYPQELRNGFKS
jgi:hypothetical protein